MSKYENAMKLIEDFCGNGKDNLIALATIALSLNATGNPRPAVRMVDSIVLRITLTEGTITDNDKKYGEWQYKVDFAKKEVK